MRLLLLTPWYAPLIHPRAHRWTALAEHWAAAGHEVHVVCAQQQGRSGSSKEQGVQVHRVGYDSLKAWFFRHVSSQHERGQVGQTPTPPGWPMRLLMGLYRQLWQGLYFPDDAVVWQKPALKKAIQLFENQHFDALITVSLPFSSHQIGYTLHRRYPTLPWVADVGDPFALQTPPLNRWRQRSRRWEQRVFASATAVTVTTPATMALFEKEYGKQASERLRVIPPLLHPLPEWEDRAEKRTTSGLDLGYFGTFYRGVRGPELLLQLLAALRQSHPDLSERLRVHFYGDLPPELLPILQRTPGLELHGLVSRTEARQAMRQMHGLLHLGNHTPAQLPSKVLDYLAARRPVLHLSALPEDAFTQFWGPRPGLTHLRSPNSARFAEWLKDLKDTPDLPAPDLEPFTVESIAGQYLGLV